MHDPSIMHVASTDTGYAEILLRQLLVSPGARCAFVFTLDQYWLSPSSPIELIVVAESFKAAENDKASLRVVIGHCPEQLALPDATEPLERIAQNLGAALFDLSQPWTLQQIEIPKPWGREIWFTGVEARGVCQLAQGEFRAPIPWLIEVCGALVAGGASKKLVLLKILDPLPEPVFGDLYVELHERKQEVYVVTQVDSVAWPDGVGAIRFGFNQSLLATYKNEAAFRSAYIDATKRYRAVRVQIDQLLDQERQKQQIALDAPLSASIQQQWLALLPTGLLEQEASLRAQMEQFYGSLPLQVGDVIKVPCYVPHSLQHGVTTIEFQTPVFERKILSFAQKVLTQSRWDTEEAMTLCGVGAVEPGSLEPIAINPQMSVERIVDFDSFEVFRLTMSGGASADLAKVVGHANYLIVMVVVGSVMAQSTVLMASSAIILGAMSSGWDLTAHAGEAVVVVANPKTTAVC